MDSPGARRAPIDSPAGRRAPDTRRETILVFLEMRGRANLGELVSQLEISKQGALRHLEALEEAGLATVASAAPHGRGRPESVYPLTEAAGGALSGGPPQA